MIWIIIGITLGIAIGQQTSFSLPPSYIQYSAVIIIAIIDFLFSIIKAEVKKVEHNHKILFTGLGYNVVVALALTYLGNQLGIDLYLAVAIFFIFHIFNNIKELRKHYLRQGKEKA